MSTLADRVRITDDGLHALEPVDPRALAARLELLDGWDTQRREDIKATIAHVAPELVGLLDEYHQSLVRHCARQHEIAELIQSAQEGLAS